MKALTGQATQFNGRVGNQKPNNLETEGTKPSTDNIGSLYHSDSPSKALDKESPHTVKEGVLQINAEPESSEVKEVFPVAIKELTSTDNEPSIQYESAVITEKEPFSIPAEIELPPSVSNEGKPLLIPEGGLILSPASDTPSLSTDNETHPSTPKNLHHPKETEKDVRVLEVEENEFSIAEVEGERISEKAGSEDSLEVIIQNHSASGVEESSSSTTDERLTVTTTPTETPQVEEKHLEPTEDLKQVPAISEKESPPVVTKEEPSTKEPLKPGEVEKFSEESLPTIEQPHVVAEKETLPGIEEKTPPESATPEEPSSTVAKELPPVVIEKESPPLVEEKEPQSITSVEEPPAAPAREVTDTEKEEGVEPLAGVPETSEEPVTLPEPPKLEEVKEVKPTWDIWHVEPIEMILLGVAITIIAAKVGGEVARLMRVPEVVGKVIIGMLLGNLYYFTGWNIFNFLRVMPFLENLAYFGALTLLLSAGIHTDLKALLKVGASSALVCLGGIIAPGGLGLLVFHFLLSDTPIGTKFLMAIVLCSSSIGLILATLQELKSLNGISSKSVEKVNKAAYPFKGFNQ